METLRSVLSFPTDSLSVVNFSRYYCRSVTGLAPRLYYRCQSLGSDRPQILVGPLQSLLAVTLDTHLSRLPSTADTLLLRAGPVTSLCCLMVARAPIMSVAPLSLAFTALPVVLPSGCFSLSSVTLGTQAFSQGLFPAPQPSFGLVPWNAHIYPSIWAAPTDLCGSSLLAASCLRTPSLLFPKPRPKAGALHFTLMRICPHLASQVVQW